MNRRHAVGLVFRREITERLRSKAFLFSTLFTLLMLALALGLPVFLAGRDVTYQLGTVGDGNQPVIDAARSLANGPKADSTTTFVVVPFDSLSAADTAVDSGRVDAALVNGAQLVVRGAGGENGGRLESLLQQAASSVRIEQLTRSGAGQIISLLQSDPLTIRSLSGVDPTEDQARALVAFGGMFLMYIAVLTYGNWTLTGVTEEKSNRVVEVLLATLEPWQLLAGKIVGIGTLGLAQFVVTMGIAVLGIELTGTFALPSIPLDTFAVLILWFVLGYALFAVAFGAAGSLVSRSEDAQSASTPITLVAVVGFIASVQVLNDPSSVFARVATYIPVTAPFVVPVRVAFRSITWWEVALAAAVTVVAVVGLVRLAGRVYAGALLRFGARVSWRDAFRGAD